ncbi:MAG TPA: type III-B CRISPR module RAMP protein Cmr6, partial [Kofleriaceae bacterium]|nr:type III-B CRISPR module RAMP protein Cmr6 [Kofleriaceae bacterium]
MPEHIALGYGAWARIDVEGKVSDEQRASWLNGLSQCGVSPDYPTAFQRWKSSLCHPGDRMRELTLQSRLLIGHGNPSPTDVGLTVHHTWGVPVIPGSALKGMLAHYVDAVYGPDDPTRAPWDQPDGQRERARYQGVIWNDPRIQHGPGDVYRTLFGAPDADEDDTARKHDSAAGAQRGLVVFHDALYVPGTAEKDCPYAADVLTVHQKPYYDSQGNAPPSDYASPNPVGFLSVRPKVKLLVALSGPADWTALAERLLYEALAAWGVGGKTSSGYGRLSDGRAAKFTPDAGGTVAGANVAPGSRAHSSRNGDPITVTRVKDVKGKVKFQADDGTLGHFTSESPPDIA